MQSQTRLGGGRLHFKTTGIPDGKGGILKLNDGDKIEYLVEVHADLPSKCAPGKDQERLRSHNAAE